MEKFHFLVQHSVTSDPMLTSGVLARE